MAQAAYQSSSQTANHTWASGTNRYLLRLIFDESSGTNIDLTDCTYGGVSGTILANEQLVGNQLSYAVVAWNESDLSGLADDASHSFVETYTVTPSSVNYINVQCQNVEQAAPYNEIQKDSNTSSNITAVTVAHNATALLLAFNLSGSSVTWSHSTMTQREESSPTGHDAEAATQQVASAGSTQLEFSPSLSARSAQFGIAINGSGTVGVSITSVSSDDVVTMSETDVVIAGALFGASQGTGVLTLSPTDDVSDVNATEVSTVDSWSDTSIQFDMPANLDLPYGTNYLFVTNDSAQTNANGQVITINPDSGKSQKTIHATSPQDSTTQFSIFQNLSGIVAGTDQVEYVTTSAQSGTVLVTHCGIAEISYAGSPPASDSFTYRVWDSDSSAWTSEYTVSFNVSSSGGSQEIVNSVIGGPVPSVVKEVVG